MAKALCGEPECEQKVAPGFLLCTVHGGLDLGAGGIKDYWRIADSLLMANGRILADIGQIIENYNLTGDPLALAEGAHVLDRWESTSRNVARILQVVMPLVPPDDRAPHPEEAVEDLMQALAETRLRAELL